MSEKVTKDKQGSKAEQPAADKQPQRTDEQVETQERLDDDIASILDEIDEVLEENAEEFVRGFIQKGGQ